MVRIWKKEKNLYNLDKLDKKQKIKNVDKLWVNNVDLIDHLSNHVDYKLIHDHGNGLGAPAGTIPKYHNPPSCFSTISQYLAS